MLKNLANEINNLLLDNEEKTQEILSLNSSIGSLSITIETLQNENQSLLDVKAELKIGQIMKINPKIIETIPNILFVSIFFLQNFLNPLFKVKILRI